MGLDPNPGQADRRGRIAGQCRSPVEARRDLQRVLERWRHFRLSALPLPCSLWSLRGRSVVRRMRPNSPGSARVSARRRGGILMPAGIAQKESSHAQTHSYRLAVCWDVAGRHCEYQYCLRLVFPRLWVRLRRACLWLRVYAMALSLLLRTKILLWLCLLSPPGVGLARVGLSRLGLARWLGWTTLGGLAALVEPRRQERRCLASRTRGGLA